MSLILLYNNVKQQNVDIRIDGKLPLFREKIEMSQQTLTCLLKPELHYALASLSIK